MNVNGISRISFGYNKEYHDKVENYLTGVKQNRDIALHLAELDKISMKMEDDIIELENRKKTNTAKFDKLVNCLIDLKNSVTYNIESSFPKLKYCDNEIEQYKKEFDEGKDKDGWRYSVCKNLSSFSVKYFNEFNIPSKSSADKLPPPSDLSEKPVAAGESEIDFDDDFVDEAIKSYLTLEIPNEYFPNGFEDVIGLDNIKAALKEDIIEYANSPEFARLNYIEYGLKAPRGFLFYGPPGCGKTMLVKALAAETGLSLYKMDISKLGSCYINQTSVNIQDAFEYLAQIAKKNGKPVLLFMDEVDALAINRDAKSNNASTENTKATTTLLKMIEQAREQNIIPIAATNKYDMLDGAFVDRFDGQYYIPLPKDEQIESLVIKLLSGRLKGKNLAQDRESIKKLTQLLHGYSNRSITFIIDSASKIAKNDNRSDISFEHIKKAISEADLEKIDEKEYIKDSKKSKIGF